MVRFDGVGLRYPTLPGTGPEGGSEALRDISFSLPEGSFHWLLGPSGAGKSTLLRMVNRLTEPSAGRILFDGADVTALRGRALRDWRARCAMVFRQFNLVQRLDVLTNVLVGRLNHRSTVSSLLKLFTAEERAMALSALDRFDPDFLGLTGSLSTVKEVAGRVGVDISGRRRLPGGGYEVGHSAQVVGFDRGRGVVLWTPETSVADLATDVTLLAEQAR